MAERKLKILTLEDSPDVQLILKEALLLKIPEATVTQARTVDQTLELALQEHPDVITVDIDLPGGKDGWRFLDELSRQSIRNIPTIVVSALPPSLVEPEAERRGVPFVDSLNIVTSLPTAILSLLESR